MPSYAGYMNRLPDEVIDEWKRQTWVKNAMERGLSLAEAYGDPFALSEAAAELSNFESSTLRLIIDCSGCSPFELKTLLAWTGFGQTGAEINIGLIGLRRRGVVCTFRKMWGERLFALPWEGFCIWRELFDKTHVKYFLPREEDAQTPVIAAPLSFGLAKAIFMLLLVAAKQELPLTTKGALTKRHIKLCEEVVKLPNPPLAECGLQYAMCDVYAPGLEVTIDLAMRLGLLETGGALQLKADKLPAWLALDLDEQQAVLYKLWFELHQPEQTFLQHAAAIIERMEPGVSFSLDSIAERVVNSRVASDLPEQAALSERLRIEWCAPLAAFGFLEVYVGENGRPVYRQRISVNNRNKSNLGHIDRPHPVEPVNGDIYVQPDFELIVQPTAPLAVCWEAALLGETTDWEDDCMRIFLTKDSFYETCRLGRTADSILRFLSQHALYGVPENVAETIRGWGSSFGKARIAEATLLYCTDEHTADTIAATQRCSAYLLSRIAPDVFVVQRDAAAALSKELKIIGIVPASPPSSDQGSVTYFPELTSGDAAAHIQAVGFFGQNFTSTKGLIMGKNTDIPFHPDTRLPTYDDAYAGLSDVPVSWLNGFHAYHPSTRKDIIRKAIEWRSYLKLGKDGTERTVVPQMLSEYGGGWSILGLEREAASGEPFREVRVGLDEWEEMQLILPGKEVLSDGSL